MNKKMDEVLRKKGFIPVEEYLENNVVSIWRIREEFHLKSMERVLEAVRFYEEASQAFHAADGDGYYIVQRCLQKYLDYKFIRRNRKFRFEEDETLQIAEDKEFEYIAVDGKKKESFVGSRADIYYLLYMAEQTSAASRRCREYTESKKLHLTAVLIRLIEQVVESMEKDQSERLKTYGKILRTAYMDPRFAEADVPTVLKALDLSKKQYYRMRSEAITFLSENLFGILAGENGMAELYIDDEKIILPVSVK